MVNISSFMGPLVAARSEGSHTQDINRWAGCDPITLYLWKLICKFNAIFLSQNIFLQVFSKQLKNVKTILS